MVKKIEYTILLIEDTQIRHIHTHWKNEVMGFCLQLEIYIKENWKPIVRYDTTHGFAHKDIIHSNGSKEKIPLYFLNFKSALNFIDRDLKSSWSFYREQFLKEAKYE